MYPNEKENWYFLKDTIAQFMVPRLENYKIKFQEDGVAIPTWLSAHEKENYSNQEIELLKRDWLEVIDCMIFSFNSVLDLSLQIDEDKVQLGLDLFAKYYLHLWD